jgi:NADH-quinone oxidoreductase subunit F
MSPEQVISEIKQSGLRGRGGAGYATYLKWSAVHNNKSNKKYIICNGDEGDPGAFMDRMLIESYPYRVIEGAAIAAYTVGADQAYFYIRAEYPLAVKRMNEAINTCKQRGFLGNNIADSSFSLQIKVVAGAGAFVCGEETALIASIEGRRGMPRLRPPYPAESGLWGKPTLINNVETYAVIPWIIRNGPKEFAKLGTKDSKGAKVFALAGKIARGGLVEVPMGISIRRIIEEIGGGITEGLKLKAVQIGGPSGGCVPVELTHIPVDFETLNDIGAMMGSGGMVALDESDCMVDIARYFLEFTQDQSCGKCTFCRIGTRRMLDILERLCAGEGKKTDIRELEYLAKMIQQTSICGLGRTAPNPVLSTIKYFREEYWAHLNKRCPAGRCRALITYSITDDCIGCTLCAQHCPADAIEMKPYQKHEIDPDKCIRCGTCKSVCRSNAVKVE